MLNISLKRVNDDIDLDRYKSFKILEKKNVSSYLLRIVLGLLLIGFLSMFLPWTQNIRSKGYVTTRTPQDRPQTVQTLIGGRIEDWYVTEGQHVSVGDTIIKISEVKESYLDPQLLDNTQGQIEAKKGSAKAYEEKAENLRGQYQALINSREAKLTQNRIKRKQVILKIQSDSLDLQAAQTKLDIAEFQLKRIQNLFDEGLKSLTDLEAKRLGVREARAKVVGIENKLATNYNELDNIVASEQSIINEYADKMAKSRSDMNSALSSQFDALGNVNKLQSDYNAYVVRQNNYYILSPINGQVTKAIQSGIGELVKNGDKIVSIMPDNYQLAVEMYVDPMDVPLLNIDQKVRIQFDGWPSIVFSGWPNASMGTFGGQIFAIDNFISDNGKYRVLVEADPNEIPWPREVRYGGGANTISLLKDVFVGYELWRKLNGFPPDYYKSQKSEQVKSKEPLRKLEKI